MTLTFDDMNIILAIIKFGNFSNASKMLYMTQSSLSKRVQNIEKRLGYKIFVRKRGMKNAELTDKGESLIPIIRQMKNLSIKAQDIKYKNVKAKLGIASSDGPYSFIIEDAILELYQKNENLLFKMKNLSYRECIEAVSDEIVDIAFVGNNIYKKDLSIIPLYSEKMVFICLGENEVEGSVSIEDLDIDKAIYSPYSSEYSSWFWYTFDGEQPLFRCDLITNVIKYMRTMNLWSIVPISVANYISEFLDISILPIDDEVPNRIIYYVVKTGVDKIEIENLLEIIKNRIKYEDGIYLFEEN